MTRELHENPIGAKNGSALTRWFLGLRALWILKNDAANPYYAAVLHTALDYDTYARIADGLCETPGGRAFLAERRTIPGASVDLATLAKLPAHTLGRAFADYFASNKLEPFTYEYPIGSDGEFLYKRYRETHDIHHLITGYGVDEIGEVELQAFYYGNLGLRHAALIALGSIPYMLTKGGLGHLGPRKLLARLRAAYRRGRDSRELLSIPFDALWDKPVTELARLICPPA